MVDNRKQAVSIRMNSADVRKVKKLASRLGVRDSDIIRFAVKSMLSRLGPLYDTEVRGRSLVPVFVESGAELLRYFDLDASRLDSIINGEAAGAERQVTNEDIALIAMSGAQENYARLKLSSLGGAQDEQGLSQSLRSYLYEKYVYRHDGHADANGHLAGHAASTGDTGRMLSLNIENGDSSHARIEEVA